MKSLTCCQANRTRAVGVKTVRRDTAGPGLQSLTYYQANRTRVGVRTVRRDIGGHGMKSLTCCQANRTRVGVRIVRGTQLDLAWNHSPSIKSTGPEWE